MVALLRGTFNTAALERGNISFVAVKTTPEGEHGAHACPSGRLGRDQREPTRLNLDARSRTCGNDRFDCDAGNRAIS